MDLANLTQAWGRDVSILFVIQITWRDFLWFLFSFGGGLRTGGERIRTGPRLVDSNCRR